MYSFLYRLDVHSRKIRVGIIRYGRKTSRLVDLRTGTSKRRLCSLLARGIKCSPYLSTNTHLALKDADFLFVRQSRSNCAKKLLLITASHDECLENTTKIAYKLKNGNTDLTVICKFLFFIHLLHIYRMFENKILYVFLASFSH